MNGVNENDSNLCTASILEDDTEAGGLLSTTSSGASSDSSYSDNDYLGAIYETSVQSLVVEFTILVILIIGGFARLMDKFFA